MATNQMRREAAKRKLKSQQERRAAAATRRQRVAVLTSVGVVVVVLVAVVVLVTTSSGSEEQPQAAAPSGAAAATGECTFTPGEPAAKAAPVPTATTAPTSGTVPVTITTDRGAIPVTLDRAAAPCTVESFLGLTEAGFYDATPCHRLTTGSSLSVLQCGDPTGTGTGGPGYTVNDEKPTDLAVDPATGASIYPRGVLAMANTGQPDSGGSQFFLVYADSTLPPDYTVFGTIDEAGLAVLDQIAAAGTADGAPDGAPAQPVTITQVTAS